MVLTHKVEDWRRRHGSDPVRGEGYRNCVWPSWSILVGGGWTLPMGRRSRTRPVLFAADRLLGLRDAFADQVHARRYIGSMSIQGEQIRGARRAAGLSQAELARWAGTSQPAVNRYEQGRINPTTATTERLLSACQVRMRPSELLANNAERVRRLAISHGALRVLVFGSVARGEDDVDSDLDLLVEIPSEHLRLLDLIELGHEVSDALGVKVDIATPEMLKPSIRAEVLAEARIL